MKWDCAWRWERILEMYLQLAKKRYVDPAFVASLYTQLGEKDQAFAWLGKAYSEKSDLLAYIKTIADFDSLHSDPRYAALLEKGKTTYTIYCVACHGERGAGDGSVARTLDPRPRNFATDKFKQGSGVAQIFGTLGKGVPGTAMTKFTNLSEEERWAVAWLGPAPGRLLARSQAAGVAPVSVAGALGVLGSASAQGGRLSPSGGVPPTTASTASFRNTERAAVEPCGPTATLVPGMSDNVAHFRYTPGAHGGTFTAFDDTASERT